MLGFVIGVAHGKVRTLAATAGKQATVLRSTRYIFINQAIGVSILLYIFISAVWIVRYHYFRVNHILMFLFRNCIGAPVTKMIAVKYQVHPMALFCQVTEKAVYLVLFELLNVSPM